MDNLRDQGNDDLSPKCQSQDESPSTVALAQDMTHSNKNVQEFAKAISDGDVLLIEKMLKEKTISVNKLFHISTPSGRGPLWTPLTYAIQCHVSKEIFDTILKAGADMNIPCHINKVLYTPLHMAVNQGGVGFVLLMLDAGADINQYTGVSSVKEEEGGIMKFNEGFTLLHWCVLRNDPRFIDLLLECGADTQRVSGHGETPLHLTLDNPYQQEKNIKKFIQHGGLTIKENREGLTLLAAIMDYMPEFVAHELPDLVKFILNAGYDLRNDLCIKKMYVSERYKDYRPHTCAIIKEWLCEPCKLKVLCRCTIRQAIGTRIKPGVFYKLPLPSELRKYVSLQDGFDFFSFLQDLLLK